MGKARQVDRGDEARTTEMENGAPGDEEHAADHRAGVAASHRRSTLRRPDCRRAALHR
jgi:hypothetical protein